MLNLLVRGNLKLLLICFFLYAIYLSNLQAVIIFAVNSESRTLSRIDTSTDQVQNAFAQLGIIPNKVIVDENYLWSVNSGDNSVQKINKQTGSTVCNILIEAGCNPWDAVLDGDFLYVTGLFTNKVYKVHTVNHNVVGFVEVGISPEALCVYNGKLFVTNTGGYQNNYANSSVSVIDLQTFQVIQTIPVSSNPQYIIEHNGLLHVSCTGNWVSTFGAVCVINPVTYEVIQTLNLGGSLGGIWINGAQQALVGDGNGLYLYRYNTNDFSIINDASHPFTPGGSVVDGNNELIALLSPNWGSNGKVKILHPDLSLWKEYSIGLAPTDLKLGQSTTAIIDETLLPELYLTVYPNPAIRKGYITFKTSTGSDGTVSIYNIKGQHIFSVPFRSGIAKIDSQIISAGKGTGCYFYRIKTFNKVSTGKFVIID